MTATYTLDAMLAELISQGYEVTFTAGSGAQPFAAHVEKPGDPDAGITALGATAQAALRAALPLLNDGDPFPCACGHAQESHWEHAEPEGPRAGCAILGCPCKMYGEYVPAAPAVSDQDAWRRTAALAYPAAEPVEAKAHRDIERQELWTHVNDAEERLEALEARAGKFDRTEAALVDVIVELLADQSPDGELARRIRERRAGREDQAPAAG